MLHDRGDIGVEDVGELPCGGVEQRLEVLMEQGELPEARHGLLAAQPIALPGEQANLVECAAHPSSELVTEGRVPCAESSIVRCREDERPEDDVVADEGAVHDAADPARVQQPSRLLGDTQLLKVSWIVVDQLDDPGCDRGAGSGPIRELRRTAGEVRLDLGDAGWVAVLDGDRPDCAV